MNKAYLVFTEGETPSVVLRNSPCQKDAIPIEDIQDYMVAAQEYMDRILEIYGRANILVRRGDYKESNIVILSEAAPLHEQFSDRIGREMAGKVINDVIELCNEVLGPV